MDARLSYDIDGIIQVQVTGGQTGRHRGEFEIERTANMDGVVAQVMRDGYPLGDRVLRAQQVWVCTCQH